MSTNIECTKCGDLFALEGDSVSLPFVCTGCEKQQEELAVEAEASRLAADAEQAQVEDEQKATYDELAATVTEQAHELDDAHLAEELSYKVIAKLMRTLDKVAAERDLYGDMAVHNANEGLRAVADLEKTIKAGKALETERNLAIKKFQAMKAQCVRLSSVNNHYADRIESLRQEVRRQRKCVETFKGTAQQATFLYDRASDRANRYRELYLVASERNAELVKQAATPWYRKLGQWWTKLGSLPVVPENTCERT